MQQNAQCHLCAIISLPHVTKNTHHQRPPCWDHSNAAPSSIFAVTNSAATLPNYHAPDTEQLTIAHPFIAHLSIAHPLILLPMMVHQKMVQPGAAFGGTTCDGNTHHGAANHATMYDGTAYDSANASGTAFDCASKDSVAYVAALP